MTAERIRIAVFTKAPTPGRVKTRLASRLGAEGAASLHVRLARRAVATAIEAGVGPVELWCSPDPSHDFFRACAQRSGVTLHAQPQLDLGGRMNAAFAASHARGEALLVIGTDCPAFDAATLREAAATLASHDAVVIPAEDGGYVLLGLARPAPTLLEGITWGSTHVMRETRERLRSSGLRWAEMPTLWDVDRPEDYERLLREGFAEAHA